MGLAAAMLLVSTTACDKNGTPPAAGSATPAASSAAALSATASTTATAAATATPSATAATQAPDVEGLAALEEELRKDIPKGSGDYARALALATLHKDGKLPYADLEKAVLALKLPPHKLGDGYLMIPVPKPPNPADWNPKMMPKDWQGTWGELAMAYWLGKLDKDVYGKLHQAAHPDCKPD
ncbi:MAG: hypothetical protein JRI68_30945 [Deltaproteobacteria bacterium]|nr:hypothetical protein [Deltaproteobacteria bacterium]